MAFSDLCHLGNAYQTIENETDQSENIMDDSFVRDLIVNLLEEGPPSDSSSSIPPMENNLSIPPNQYRDSGTSLLPPYNYQNPLNFNLNDQNGFNYNMQNGLQNGFGNGFVNYSDNDVNTLLGVDLPDTTDTVSPEQLNLLRLAAQEIGGAQFQSPNGNYNFFEPSQRNSLPETNMFSSNNFNRPNSLNLDMNFNNFDAPFNNQRFANNFKDNQDPSEILSYLTQLNMSLSDRNRDDSGINSIDFNKPPDLNGHYNEDFKAIEERNKMNQFFNRNFQQPNRTNENNHFFENMQERPPINFDFSNQTPVSTANNFKSPNGLNGFHQNDYMQRNMNQMQNFPNEQRNNFENNVGRDNMQQMALMRQQELARQMSLFMRNRPPPNQLNVDVSYLHDNNHFNLGLGALLGPSPPHPPPVLPSPGIDIPLLAPFYAMRNIRNAATSSGVLHARLDMCYEQWRQLERERKRTEARLALAYPGRAVSSSNSIPVPRLPPCPTRVDRLTVDMLREHTKVLTLMGKMETLRASVCVSQKKNKPEENKITVLKRGQENVLGDEPGGAFEPDTWRDDLNNIKEIAPHKEVENAMLNWRNAVTNVQAARKRELHPNHHNPRSNASDPILQLADAVKNLCVCARRARCAMWCDLTLTVALAPPPYDEKAQIETVVNTPQTTPTKQATPDKAASNATPKPTSTDNKEEKATAETAASQALTNTKPAQTKLTDKEKRDRRQANYKKHVQRNDFYRNQRYDVRFIQSRNPYHYLATGPIN